VLEKAGTKYDITSFVLGTIAPDSALTPKNDSAYRLHHFILTETELSDLAFFVDMNRSFRQKSNISERSFIDGYYAHLWLDNFMRTYGEDIRLVSQTHLTEKEIRSQFKENIKHYDFVAIKDFVTRITTPPLRMRTIPGIDFISFASITKLWNQFVASFKEFKETESLTVIVTQEQHERFLENSADEFVKVFKTSPWESSVWTVH
jgi:hypothetical protein